MTAPRTRRPRPRRRWGRAAWPGCPRGAGAAGARRPRRCARSSTGRSPSVVDRVPAAVAGVVPAGEVADAVDRRGGVGPGEARDDVVALDVDVRGDAVGDLEGPQGQSDAAVVGAGGEPVHGVPAGQHPALRTPPEPHVVPLGRVALDLLLVGEVLLPVEQVQRAHRCLGDSCAATASRRRSACCWRASTSSARVQPAAVIAAWTWASSPTQGEVDRVPEQPVAGPGPADEVAGEVEVGEHPVQPRQHEVGHQCPEHHEQQHLPVRTQARPEQQVGQPHRGEPGEHEEEGVQGRGQRPEPAPGSHAGKRRSGDAPAVREESPPVSTRPGHRGLITPHENG